MPLTVSAKQIDSMNLHIRKFKIGVITELLKVETQRRFIDITDTHIQTN